MGPRAPRWPDRQRLERKFRQHRRDFARHNPLQPLAGVAEYEQSSVDTIRDGVRFTYTDDTHDVPRVGYFAPSTGLLTVLTESERVIVTHFPADEEYVRALLDSDYP